MNIYIYVVIVSRLCAYIVLNTLSKILNAYKNDRNNKNTIYSSKKSNHTQSLAQELSKCFVNEITDKSSQQ